MMWPRSSKCSRLTKHSGRLEPHLGMIFSIRAIESRHLGGMRRPVALAIFALSRRFSLLGATLLSWFFGFVLMWLVLWNLNVLPSAILVYAIPLSLLETFIGIDISRNYSPPMK